MLQRRLQRLTKTRPKMLKLLRPLMLLLQKNPASQANLQRHQERRSSRKRQLSSWRQEPMRLHQSSHVRRNSVKESLINSHKRLTRTWSIRLRSAQQLSSRLLKLKRLQLSPRLLLSRPASLPLRNANLLSLSVRIRLQPLNLLQHHPILMF